MKKAYTNRGVWKTMRTTGPSTGNDHSLVRSFCEAHVLIFPTGGLDNMSTGFDILERFEQFLRERCANGQEAGAVEVWGQMESTISQRLGIECATDFSFAFNKPQFSDRFLEYVMSVPEEEEEEEEDKEDEQEKPPDQRRNHGLKNKRIFPGQDQEERRRKVCAGRCSCVIRIAGWEE